MRRLEIRMVSIRIRYITGISIGHQVFPANRVTTESRRADSNRFPHLITSWLIAIPRRSATCQYVANQSRTLSRGGVARPTAYRLVPIRLQYGCSTLSNRTGFVKSAFPNLDPTLGSRQDRYRNGRKKARRSSASNFGSSIAGKCPPRAILPKRLRSE